MKRKLKLVNDTWQQPSTSPQIMNPEKVELRLPDISTLTPDLTFIVAKAEAVNQASITHEQAESQVAQHHHEIASAHLSTLSQLPSGLKSSKQTELVDVKSDLTRVDSQLAKIDKYTEVDVASDTPKTLAEKVELFATATAALLLAGWSIYAMHSFLEGTGILSGLPAWGVSIGPIVIAYVMKDALQAVGEERKKVLRLAYISLTGIASVVWISTFGQEAGAPTAALNSLEPSVVADNTTWFLVRGIAQMFIEIFGGAILFLRTFELWKKNGPGQKVDKELLISPMYEAAERDRTALRNRELILNKQLGQIQQWFDTHAPFKEQLATKATSELTHNLNILQGK